MTSYHVRHVNTWEIRNLPISDKEMKDLKRSRTAAQSAARTAICTRFRAACLRKYGTKWSGVWVSWEQLKIIGPSQPLRPTRSVRPGAMPVSTNGNPLCNCDGRGRCSVHDAR
ncbi:MAG TPA: hypothetical protein VF597_02570 [Candidatus Saccharimonadales bacterium]